MQVLLQVYQLLAQGGVQRTTGRTKMNENSSRSHAVFTIIIEKSSSSSGASEASLNFESSVSWSGFKTSYIVFPSSYVTLRIDLESGVGGYAGEIIG